MLFNSLQYAAFLPVVVIAHRLVPAPWRAGLLLAASYVFYAAWSPWYLPLIIGLTLLNGLIGLGLERRRGQVAASRWLLGVGIAANLLVLGYYKYLLFAFDSTLRVLALVQLHPELPQLSPVLPLGISFFMFEFIHYLVDVHRGGPAVRSPLKFALFAAFFPTQVAGPIKRYEQFVPQIDSPAPLDWTRLGDGTRLIVTGLFKKMALADNLSPIVGIGFAQGLPSAGGLNPLDAWLAVVAFAFQIYSDFSGYTDIGRGSAVLLGYNVPENFRRPYLARNVSEFWRRWHISLSTWLRDYLYIPLGGNRAHQRRNLMLTMALGGLWHGASTTYVVWGALHGAYLTVFWSVRGGRRGGAPATPPWSAAAAIPAWALTFALICVGWVFFRATNTSHALVMLASMLGAHVAMADSLLSTQRLIVLVVAAGTLAIEAVLEWRERVPSISLAVPAVWRSWATELRPLGYTAMFWLAVLMEPGDAGRFIYFQF